jgi:hypothetical protein
VHDVRTARVWKFAERIKASGILGLGDKPAFRVIRSLWSDGALVDLRFRLFGLCEPFL